jgi:4-hydroxythreonine-4-phosphate dehydrogenase
MVLGDPAGVGPELVARLLAKEENRRKAGILIIGDRDELEVGIRIAGAAVRYRVVSDPRAADLDADVPALWDFRGQATPPFARAEASANGGRYCLDTLGEALTLTADRITDALCFAPLNKSSLHQAGLGHADETHWFAQRLGASGPVGEVNVLGGLWTSRVTSHVALRDVADLITEVRILGAVRLVHDALVRSGEARPRLAVCGLNPHNGDNGSFGREEIDVIAPAVAKARGQGFRVTGPYPADTVFLKADEVDGIVTMYHDQGQIAVKLMGFTRGVTIHGGLPIPIATPAHGTAFDIYGRGQAQAGAMQAAFDMACRMAGGRPS